MKRSNYSIEVLRCWLMFLIVLMHCATFVNTGDPSRARLVHTFCVFAVNAFVLISGWFGIRFAPHKVFRLLGLGLFSALVLLALSPLAGKGWVFSYDLGWFGCAYLGLLFFAPLINAAIDHLRGQSEGALRTAWFVYACMMVMSWVPIDISGVHIHIRGWEGHSFNQLCFMYVTGRVLAGCDFVHRIKKGWLYAAAVLLMSANYAWAIATGLTRGNEFWQSMLVGTRGNNNPIIILLAIAIFLILLRSEPPRWLGRVCMFLGPSMFSVYLLHEATNHGLSVALYNKYLFIQGGQFVAIIATAILVYSVCIAFDLIRRMAFLLLSKISQRRNI